MAGIKLQLKFIADDPEYFRLRKLQLIGELILLRKSRKDK